MNIFRLTVTKYRLCQKNRDFDSSCLKSNVAHNTRWVIFSAKINSGEQELELFFLYQRGGCLVKNVRLALALAGWEWSGRGNSNFSPCTAMILKLFGIKSFGFSFG